MADKPNAAPAPQMPTRTIVGGTVKKSNVAQHALHSFTSTILERTDTKASGLFEVCIGAIVREQDEGSLLGVPLSSP